MGDGGRAGIGANGTVPVNPIPLNPTPGSIWTASNTPVAQEFIGRLRAAGVPCTPARHALQAD